MSKMYVGKEAAEVASFLCINSEVYAQECFRNVNFVCSLHTCAFLWSFSVYLL